MIRGRDMKIKGRWLILTGDVVVAGVFAAFGLKLSTQTQHIRSLIDGTVVARNVDVGQTVAASHRTVR